MILDVIFCPSAVPSQEILAQSIVVVIDVFRASATMAALMEARAAAVRVCSTIEDAQAQAEMDVTTEVICVGERQGMAPPGFRCGNSPLEIRGQDLRGVAIYYATTNGTRMLSVTAEAAVQLVASFGTQHELSKAIDLSFERNNRIERVLFCCSGNDGGFSLEDSFFAGAFIAGYIANSASYHLTDAAQAAVRIARAYTLDPFRIGKEARHARLLRDMGFGVDVDFCLRTDQFSILPQCSGMDLRQFS